MTTCALPVAGSGTFAHGIHPHDQKALSAGKPIEVLPTPKVLLIPVLQNIGGPSKSVVKLRQEVALGERICEATGPVSVPMHASLAGTCGKPTRVTLANGRHVDAVPITVKEGAPAGQDLMDRILGGEWSDTALTELDPKTTVEAIREAGIVGMGGAAFPTHIKLIRNEKKPVDVLLVNGCECEPYLTSDYRLMLEAPRPIVLGALIAARAAGATTVILASERTKPEALDSLQRAVHAVKIPVGMSVDVRALAAKYPMGGEKQTVRAAVGRTIPDGGGLPLDVGVVVQNVGTCMAIAAAVLRRQPFTHRVVSVSGAGVKTPKNLLCPIGASVQDLIDACGGFTEDAGRVIAGGPMMGFALGSLATPVTKGTSGITVLTAAQAKPDPGTTCIRCGRCVSACPLRLVPSRLALAARHENWVLARTYSITSCMECGCCAYVCPARLPLVQLIRSGKARLPKV